MEDDLSELVPQESPSINQTDDVESEQGGGINNHYDHHANYVRASSWTSAGSDSPLNCTTIGSAEERYRHWELNYHEAAIYLQEGENNDKFNTHPSSQMALPAYLLTHNLWFYTLDFIASMVLMSLALVEEPRMKSFAIPIAVHSSVELLCLLVISLELGMRMKWLGLKNFYVHIRTMIKMITLVIMLLEAIVVLVRQENHFRVTRAFRPLFLLDCHYCRGVRRFIRHIIQSLPPILDMLGLLLFFMLIFSILGFYIFSSVPHDTYFQSIQQSFISLFVLLTTANYPDVMMPAYNHSRWAVLFFIFYLSLELYFVMNLLLAVVYDAFSQQEKQKLKKLWLHEREACNLAFRLLVNKAAPSKILLKHFYGLMKYYKPKATRQEIYLMFKHLNVRQTGTLSLEEFYAVYEVAGFKWKEIKKGDNVWSTNFCHPCNKIFKGIHRFATWRWFQYGMYFVILVNFLWILADSIKVSVLIADKSSDPVVNHFSVTWYSIMFATIYVLEAIIKILGLGPYDYFTDGWNLFDFMVTLLAVIGIILEVVNDSFYYIVVLRPIRLLRLFKIKRRYRDVLGTMVILFSRMVSLGVVMIFLYYFFAIIGMELFASYDMRNCCPNSSVEANYVYDNITKLGGYYYLNNFHDILSSGVTLFELTVVNNWYIIMEGYAVVATEWSRIYFMLFYITTMVVMTVVVAFILEAFLFRIQYRTKMQVKDIDDDAVVRVEVALGLDENRMSLVNDRPFTSHYIVQQAHHIDTAFITNDAPMESQVIRYRGERRRGRNDFSLKMYADEVEEWVEEEERRLLEQTRLSELQEMTVDTRDRNRTV